MRSEARATQPAELVHELSTALALIASLVTALEEADDIPWHPKKANAAESARRCASDQRHMQARPVLLQPLQRFGQSVGLAEDEQLPGSGRQCAVQLGMRLGIQLRSQRSG